MHETRKLLAVGHGNAHALDRTGLNGLRKILERLTERRGIARVRRGKSVEQQGAILDRAGHRANRVERPAEQHRARKADAAEGDLEPHEAIKGRGNTHRPASITADTGRGEARCNGDAGTAGRAAGHAMCLEVPGIPRCSHQRIGAPAAEGELDHVEFAERHHAGGRQAFDCVRRLVGNALFEHLRAAGADTTGDIAEILVGDRQAVQWAQRKARCARLVRAVSERSRFLGIDFGKGVQLAVGLVDPLQQGIDDFPGRELLGLEAGRELREREVVQSVHQ